MKRLIMATMVTAILASSTVWAADNAPVAAQQQTQQVQQTQKTAAAERISEQGLYAMRDVQVARLALFHGDPEKAHSGQMYASILITADHRRERTDGIQNEVRDGNDHPEDHDPLPVILSEQFQQQRTDQYGTENAPAVERMQKSHGRTFIVRRDRVIDRGYHHFDDPRGSRIKQTAEDQSGKYMAGKQYRRQ